MDLHLGRDEMYQMARKVNVVARLLRVGGLALGLSCGPLIAGPEADTTARDEASLNELAETFERSGQYAKALVYWRWSIHQYGDGAGLWKRERLDRITGHWGRLEATSAQLAGRPATIGYRFRNGKKVSFEVREIDLDALAADIRAHIDSGPGRLDSDRVNLERIGNRLARGEARKYLGRQPVCWDTALRPLDGHLDRTVAVTAPLSESGAYWITARMQEGNTSHVLLWVQDTVVLRKPVDGGTWFAVLDALTGRPLSGAKVDFFGYRASGTGSGAPGFSTRTFSAAANKDGHFIVDRMRLDPEYAWMATAVAAGRRVYVDFFRAWGRSYLDVAYNVVRAYFITDRAAYRPGEEVRIKVWVRRASHQEHTGSVFAGRELILDVRDPRDRRAWHVRGEADEFGGVATKFALKADGPAGEYRVKVLDPDHVEPVTGKHVGSRVLGSAAFHVGVVADPSGRGPVRGDMTGVRRGEGGTGRNGDRLHGGTGTADERVGGLLELSADRPVYEPGQTMNLSVRTRQAGTSVMLFARPVGGVGMAPQFIGLKGTEEVVSIPVTRDDLPNFFMEAVGILAGELHTDTLEVLVPPKSRALAVAITPSPAVVRRGGPARLKLAVRDSRGQPVVSSVVLRVTEKPAHDAAGHRMPGNIMQRFWGWRRQHTAGTESTASRRFDPIAAPGQPAMVDFAAPAAGAVGEKSADVVPVPAEKVQTAARERTATETAFWHCGLRTDAGGMVTVTVEMPDRAAAWEARAWAVSHGTRVGETIAEIITRE